MATKTTTTKTTVKKTTEKAPAAAKLEPSARAAAAVAARAEKKEAASAAIAATAKPPAAETVSLIDAAPKRPRKVATESEKKSLFVPISKIKAADALAAAAPPAPPAPDPVAEPVAAPPEPVAVETPAAEEEKPDEKVVHLKPPIVVRDLAAAMNLKPFLVIHDLMEMNIFAAVNQTLEPDIAAKVCAKHGFVFEKEKRDKAKQIHKEPDKPKEPPKEAPKPREDELQSRAPIVTFMGHVDHGKTTLMDAIRKTRVAAGEAGGITQHIGAYSVAFKAKDHQEHRITFLDTPGHAAFTAMRARGASVTDIVVLVVAADDGIMPQTIEALNHAKAAKVQIVVAITKIDMAGANLDKVKGQLQERGLTPEDWGGDTICCPVSALKGQGVDALLETLLLVAEVAELRATERGVARASVIEAQVEQGRGPTATVIVKNGTLKLGDPFICGDFDGKVKSLIDDQGKPMKSAGPSTPCKVLGFAGLPHAGDELVVMESERGAKALSEERMESVRFEKLAAPTRPKLETLFETIAAGHRPVLKMVLKGDVQGSMEAIETSLRQIETKKIDIDFVHAAVGPISENDVLLATASNAIIVGFNVKVENVAANIARREGVQIKLYSIIYELIDQIKEAMAGLLEPETRENVIGHAEIKKVFDLTKGTVAGCLVTDGRISRTARARVLRARTPIYDGGLSTLRRFQDDVKEVRNGLECGIKLGDFNEYEVGDIIQCYLLEKIAQKL